MIKTFSRATMLRAAALSCSLLALCACSRSGADRAVGAAAVAPAPENPAPAEDSPGIKLTPERIGKVGVVTEALKTVDYARQVTGFGSVIPHESIAQAVAELATAQAAEKQSRSALARTQRLAGTPGALSADVEETNTRQLAVDSAALKLSQQRLSASFGQNPPWSGGHDPQLLQALADGSTHLLRVTFPLGSLPGGVPKTLNISRLGAAGADRFTVDRIWAAPADAGVPGRSFFGVLRAAELGEGERVIARAPIGAPQAGVLVPAAAALISDGKYWCYIESMPGTFVKTQIDADRPVDNGYVVTSLKAGELVVTQGAAQLLAQESNTGSDAGSDSD
jgi:hypothetical protein